MRNSKIIVLIAIYVCLAGQPSAHAQYSVDWGVSNDTGNNGFTDLNNWFTSNGYSINAETDYIGHGASDNDPFFFGAGPATFEVVSRIAGNAPFTSFGFYTGTGLGKSLVGVLGAGVDGPANTNPGSAFGVYMNAPDSFASSNFLNWFSDRSENTSQQTGGSPTNAGGDPQALIYKLNNHDYLLAWEDIDYSNLGPGQTDRDFNDAYLKVSTTTTPEPVSMALFGLGAGALGLTRLRRRKKTL